MAIIIPSAKTYERQNPKVRDNIIERVEVSAVAVSPSNEYEVSVYNSSASGAGNFMPSTLVESDDLESRPDVTGEVQNFWYAYYYIVPKYYYVGIGIKKVKNNTYINHIYTGTKNDGETSRIGVTIYGEKYSGTAKGTYPISTKPACFYGRAETFTEKKLSPRKKWSYSSYNPGTANNIEATTEEKWVNADNVNTATVVEFDDRYEINLTILCGYEEIGLGGRALNVSYNQTGPNGAIFEGECVLCEPTKVEITIYGDTIGIDLTDTTLYVPDTDKTSKKVYSVENNELLQTSNYIKDTEESAITKAFEKTKELYAKGKETATIRCSIGDYFDKYGVKRVNTNKFSRNLLPKEYLFGTTSTKNGVTATALPDGGVRIQGTNTHNERIFFNLSNQYFSDKATICYEGETSKTVGDYTISMFGEGLSNVALGYDEHNATTWLSILPGWKVDAIVYPMLNKGGFIPYEAHDSSMVFQIGDQVVPMVYGADGKDRPMSTYQDGTAKVFQVLGTKIFYDGAVWQELSLQEV